MPNRSVTLKGDRELIAKFEKLDRTMRGKVLANAVQAGALPIQNAAVIKAPIRFGTLRRSIHTEIVNASDTHAEAEIGTDLEYAPYQEFGTRKMAAHPYLRPAFDEESGNAQKEIAEALKAQLDSI